MKKAMQKEKKEGKSMLRKKRNKSKDQDQNSANTSKETKKKGYIKDYKEAK
jgi:hypothetical protein